MKDNESDGLKDVGLLNNCLLIKYLTVPIPTIKYVMDSKNHVWEKKYAEILTVLVKNSNAQKARNAMTFKIHGFPSFDQSLYGYWADRGFKVYTRIHNISAVMVDQIPAWIINIAKRS